MRIRDIVSEESSKKARAARRKRGPATAKLCKSSKPDSKLGASNLASCKAQGYRARDTGKTQKRGNSRVSLDNIKAKSEKYGGWVSPTKAG